MPRLTKAERMAKFYSGLPWDWNRYICPGCGADFCRKHEGLLHAPCENCGSYLGSISSMRVTYR
jgi:hypothetical protein